MSNRVTRKSTGGSGSTLTPFKETPGGLINGVNVNYTLTYTPIANSGALDVNGQIYTEGIDYSYTGATLTMASPLPAQFSSVPFIFQYFYSS